MTWSFGSNRDATLFSSILWCHLSSLCLLLMSLHTLNILNKQLPKAFAQTVLPVWHTFHLIYLWLLLLFLKVSVQMSLYFQVLHEHLPKIALFFSLSLLAACKFLQNTCHPLACLIIFYLVMGFFLHGWIFRSFYFSECSNLCLGSTWNIILNLYSQNEGNSFALNVLNMLGKMLKAEKVF